jgi:hypothetical protein
MGAAGPGVPHALGPGGVGPADKRGAAASAVCRSMRRDTHKARNIRCRMLPGAFRGTYMSCPVKPSAVRAISYRKENDICR